MPRAKSPHRLARELKQAEIDRRKAETAKFAAEAALAGTQMAITGGIVIGTAVWTSTRMGVVLVHENLVRGSSGLVLHPGVKAWIADEVGLIVGPVLASQLPKGLSDASIHIGVAWQDASPPWNHRPLYVSREDAERFDGNAERSVAHISAVVSGGGWFLPVWEEAEPGSSSVPRYTDEEVDVMVWEATQKGANIGEQLALRQRLQKEMVVVSFPRRSFMGVRFTPAVHALIVAVMSLNAGVLLVLATEGAKVLAGKVGGP